MSRNMRKIRGVGFCPRQYKCEYFLATIFCNSTVNIHFSGRPTDGLQMLHVVIDYTAYKKTVNEIESSNYSLGEF